MNTVQHLKLFTFCTLTSLAYFFSCHNPFYLSYDSLNGWDPQSKNLALGSRLTKDLLYKIPCKCGEEYKLALEQIKKYMREILNNEVEKYDKTNCKVATLIFLK